MTLGLLVISAVSVDGAFAQSKSLNLSGPYLGQELPGLKPTVFAPNIVSTPNWEISGTFSPDLKEFYFIREVEKDNKHQQEFVVLESKNNQWYERVISPRIGQPFISPDNQIMHLGRGYKERMDKGWSDTKRLGEDFMSFRIMQLTASNKGTYVFDEATRDGKGLLRYSRLINGKRETPKPLSKTINTGKWNAHPFIAPDESYIIWDGQRNSEVRNADLFISFRQSDGSWGEAVHMGKEINTPSGEWGAKVTPDGKYLFFNRKVGEVEIKNNKGELEMVANSDVFWVDAEVINRLRPKA